jgi:hypothetical protein
MGDFDLQMAPQQRSRLLLMNIMNLSSVALLIMEMSDWLDSDYSLSDRFND